MATVDLTGLQQAGPDPTVVRMPDGGADVTLTSLMEIGSEHDDDLIDLVTEVGKLTGAHRGEESEGEGGTTRLSMDQIKGIMPLVNRVLTMAAPSQKDSKRLLKLPLFARFQILMDYVKDQDLGNLFPSGG